MCAMAATASTPALGGAWARSARLSHRVQERSQRRGHVWMCRSTVDQKTISVEDLPLPEGKPDLLSGTSLECKVYISSDWHV